MRFADQCTKLFTPKSVLYYVSSPAPTRPCVHGLITILCLCTHTRTRAPTSQSIPNIGNSQKKGAVSKTGRLGIGFNSVYHVSYVPSFISGRHIVYFDPHARFLPKYVWGGEGVFGCSGDWKCRL